MSPADDQVTRAFEALFRVRAVESPPDEAGHRTIWHQGRRGAELVTRIDAAGRVVRQDLTLLGEALAWTRDGGPAQGAAVARRALTCLGEYSGADRFIGHLRDRLLAEHGGVAAEPVAPAAPAAVVASAGPRGRWLAVALAVIAALLLVAAMCSYARAS